jgi:hypothetical protein
MTGPSLHALQDLRRSIGVVAALCDSVIFGGPVDIADATSKLAPALHMLQRRAQRALEALETEGQR